MSAPVSADHVRENAPVAGDLDRGARLPLIAVVAVHGVADQQPFESARQVADLLLQRRYGGGEATYSSFREYPVRVPVDRAIHATASPPADPPLDVSFTNELLTDYESDRSAYDTVRLEGHRLRTPREGETESWIQRDQCHVHVYEMYWADLSRLGTGLAGIAGAGYQLISSLARLGLRTIMQVQPAQRDGVSGPLWRAYLGAHAVATFSLTLLVPFLNLALLALALAIPIAAMPHGVLVWVIGGLVLVALLALGMRIWLRRGPAERWRAPVAVVVAALAPVAAAATVLALRGALSGWTLRAGLLSWAVVTTFAILALSRAQLSQHSAARWVGEPIALATGLLLTATALTSASRVEATGRTIAFIEWIFYVLSVSWVTVLLGAAVSGALAFVAARGRAGVRKAAWTAGTTLALSTASVSALAMLIWSGVFALTERALPRAIASDQASEMAVRAVRDSAFAAGIGAGIGDSFGAPRLVAASDSSFLYRPHIAHLTIDSATAALCFDRRGEGSMAPSGVHPARCRAFSQRSMPRYLLSVASATGLLLSIASLAVVAFVGLLLAAPGVLRELWPRHDSPKARERSVPLGTWLTLGFTIFRWATMIAYVLLFAGTLLVIGLGLYLRTAPTDAPIALGSLRFLRPIADTVLFSAFGPIAGSAVAASTVGLLVLLSRFESVARVVRPALDVILDVDNYLKDRPVRRTPRARIAERFVSLLRYLAHWRREGKGYDRVIVVSHSQGSVIAAEILRYHKNRTFRDLPSLTELESPRRTNAARLPPVDLLTMGSPLRQLYGRSFPDLFAWTEGHAAVPEALLGQRATPERMHPGPSCRDVGVHSWVNLYRSGDYVGRALWRGDADESTYAVVAGEKSWHSPEHDARCRERCLGEGAHTHYWDVHAGDVAEELDERIVSALER